MATLPSPEQTARQILAIFVVYFKSRPGNVLRINNFLAVWNKRGLLHEDFNSGIEYAAREKWIEVLPDGGSFRLTQLGFETAPEEGMGINNAVSASPIMPSTGAWPKTFDTAFESYEVIGKPLGEGGAGRVFSVLSGSKERFALKCLSPDRITTDRRKRFKNEIAFCSKYEHRNIVQVVDSGLSIIKETKCPFYVMPEFPMTMRKLLDQAISYEKVLPLFGQILDGIDAAHKLGAFHRDLKPENILYDPEKNLLVIADFGIAHFEEDIIETKVETKMSAKMANLGYSAPEQRRKGGTVDLRADIFSLGLMLNEMFTGAVPHGTGYKTIGSIATEFEYLDSLVERMIQNEPGSRPDSIDTIKRELIARGIAFVALQRLDKKSKEVVPAFEAGKVAPVQIISTDWDNGQLILELSRAPEIGWVQRFQQPSTGYSSTMGAGPEQFHFAGNRATVQADEGSAQQILNFAKQYIEMATRGYQSDLDHQSKQEEFAYRQKLAKELAAAEQRARVLTKLKL